MGRTRCPVRSRKPLRDFRFWRVTHTGEIRYVTISADPIFDEHGAFRGYQGVGRDRTEEELASRRREGARFELLQAIGNLTEGVSLWDHEDRLVICNSEYYRQAGRAADKLRPGVTFSRPIWALFMIAGNCLALKTTGQPSLRSASLCGESLSR